MFRRSKCVGDVIVLKQAIDVRATSRRVREEKRGG